MDLDLPLLRAGVIGPIPPLLRAGVIRPIPHRPTSAAEDAGRIALNAGE